MVNEIESSLFDAIDSHKEKNLTFTLAENIYGLEIGDVRQIIGMQSITKIPQQPEYVKGVINLRGQIVPIIDIRKRFKEETVAYDDRTCIIILDINDITIGIIVDRVTEVISIKENDIASVPEFDNGINNSFINGVAKIDDKVIILLDSNEIIKHDKESYNNVTTNSSLS